MKFQKRAKKIYNNIVFPSFRKNKKYCIYDPVFEKMIHFGDDRYSDYTKTKNQKKRENYLKRSENIKGSWYRDPYSPNNLSRRLLWDFNEF